MATYSFFPSHTITTGEGGMILTNDKELADLARAARNHGRTQKSDILNKFHFDNLGINGKMSNVLAAIGCAVVDTAWDVIKKRRRNVHLYNTILKREWYSFSPHCYPMYYHSEQERNETLLNLDKNDIEARKLFSCLPVDEKVYKYMGYKKGDFPVAEDIAKRGLFVPIHQDLTEDDIRFVASLL